MLDIAFLRDHKEETIAGLKKKRFSELELVDQAIEMDEKRRSAQNEYDSAKAESNQISKSIGQLMKAGKKEEANEAKSKTGQLKERLKELEEERKRAEQGLQQLLYKIPNLPDERVPEGKDANDNVEVKSAGTVPELADGAVPHWDLIEKYDLIDFSTGSKVTGAGFPFYKGKAARLQRAMINYFLDKATEQGYLEVQPPLLVNEASGLGTGNLPDKEGQMYRMAEDPYYLIPTAEVPITNMYRDALVEEKDLPLKMTGYTPCFRREAGSWGADVRGLNRLHQFDKVEIVSITTPDKSEETHQQMCAYVASLLEELNLPYRQLLLCGGDISFNAALCYDFEVYSAAQKRWLEVSSVSNFKTYQANRLKVRYKDGKKTVICHTLNGSALALPRILAAILENNQTPDGINVPEVLKPYCGFDKLV